MAVNEKRNIFALPNLGRVPFSTLRMELLTCVSYVVLPSRCVKFAMSYCLSSKVRTPLVKKQAIDTARVSLQKTLTIDAMITSRVGSATSKLKLLMGNCRELMNLIIPR